ncbi:MAG: alanine racemase [Oscillospiraceae bacterium]|nr:alanine racemase [Oscillospiraceae bacterium]
MDLQKRTWAEISLGAIRHNYEAIRRTLPSGTRFLGVVKADAYGHGALAVSRLLAELGAEYLAVSCLDEAMELRSGGIGLPILILGHTPPTYVPLLIEQNLTQTVTCEAKAEEFSAVAAAVGGRLRVHIALDTGMGRLGFLCAGRHFEAGVKNVIAAVSSPHLIPEGVFTHLARSDEPGQGARDFTLGQIGLFNDVLTEVSKISGFKFPLRHCASSGGVLNYIPEAAMDMVRPGLLLYGYGDEGRLGLRPAMSLMTTVSTIKHYDAGTPISYGGTFVTERRTRMGVLPIGYADGLLRCLSGRFSFWTAGGQAPQRGRICMDMCMADLTGLDKVNLDSRVEVFGQHNSLDELARTAGTIPYELLCSVSKRVPRVYVD